MDLKESQEIKRAYERICNNLKSYENKENINYEVQSELSLYPKILRLFPTREERIKAMIMLYTVNPMLYELNNWGLKELKRYIFDTVDEEYIENYNKIFEIIEEVY